MSTYLENYLESVSTLPVELTRNFGLIKELDEKSAELLAKIEGYCNGYQKSNKKNLAELYPESTLKELRQDLQTCIDYADEKVAIAVQTYELVDKHIRRLDQDLRKFEHELEQQQHPVGNKRGANAAAPTQNAARNGVLTSVDMEMPIDPNEPTYCLCKRVSFGQMIGCDNPDCPIEWFHFECVGLNSPVKGKWYCPLCVQKRQQEKMLKKKASSSASM